MAESTRIERYMVKEVNAKVEVESKRGKEQYFGKEVEAIVEVEPKLGNGQYLTIEGEAKDIYVIVDRNVESEFTNEEEFDVLTVTHNEVTTVVQGLDKKNWILRITRELSEKTFFKGSEQIDKISQRRENLERNKLNPIVQAAIASQLLRQSKDEENNKFCESTGDEGNEASYEETPNTSVEVAQVKNTANTEIKNPSNEFGQKENAIQNFKESDKLSYEDETANANSVKLVEKIKKTEQENYLAIKNPSEEEASNSKEDEQAYVELHRPTPVKVVEKEVNKLEQENYLAIKNPSEEEASNSKEDEQAYVEPHRPTPVKVVEKEVNELEQENYLEIKNPSEEEASKSKEDEQAYVEPHRPTPVKVVEKEVNELEQENYLAIKDPSEEEASNSKEDEQPYVELHRPTSVKVVEKAKVNKIVNEFEHENSLAIKNASKEEASKLSRNQRIREIFHMDVAEVIIERDPQRL